METGGQLEDFQGFFEGFCHLEKKGCQQQKQRLLGIFPPRKSSLVLVSKSPRACGNAFHMAMKMAPKNRGY